MVEDIPTRASKLTKAILHKIGVALVCAALSTAIIGAVFLTLCGAAWFAFGNDAPPFPWPVLRLFLFLGWVVAGLVGLFHQPSLRTHLEKEASK